MCFFNCLIESNLTIFLTYIQRKYSNSIFSKLFLHSSRGSLRFNCILSLSSSYFTYAIEAHSANTNTLQSSIGDSINSKHCNTLICIFFKLSLTYIFSLYLYICSKHNNATVNNRLEPVEYSNQ